MVRRLILVLFAVCSAHTVANPEYAARHGVEGLWTYQDASKLPEDCTKLDDRSFAHITEKRRQASLLEERFAHHIRAAHQLGANYAVSKPDYSFVEYYTCQKSGQ